MLSVDLGRLDRVLEIDAVSRLARVQAGVFGPALEAQLNASGWTLGHFPDSFTHSTLGGWIATRSSGMQSDKYGDVADLTRGLRAVTPAGTVALRPVPSTSTGPSVREMLLGSEGRLGIITEATVHVHRLPEERVILGYLLPDWERGLEAMHAIAASEATPSVTRVSDAPETQFSFATRKAGSPVDRLKSRALQVVLKRRGIDVGQMCLAFIGYEGSAGHVKAQRKLVGAIVKAHGGLCIGSGPGALYDQKKFDTPYIRDYLLDRGALGDVSETAAPWSELRGLYDEVTGAAARAIAEQGVGGYVMCHLSHSYHSGACLYFTFADQPVGDARRARRVRRGQGRDPAGVRRFRRDALAPPCGRDRARALARAGHLPGRGGAAAGAVRRRRSRVEPQPGEDHRRGARAPAGRLISGTARRGRSARTGRSAPATAAGSPASGPGGGWSAAAARARCAARRRPGRGG